MHVALQQRPKKMGPKKWVPKMGPKNESREFNLNYMYDPDLYTVLLNP